MAGVAKSVLFLCVCMDLWREICIGMLAGVVRSKKFIDSYFAILRSTYVLQRYTRQT